MHRINDPVTDVAGYHEVYATIIIKTGKIVSIFAPKWDCHNDFISIQFHPHSVVTLNMNENVKEGEKGYKIQSRPLCLVRMSKFIRNTKVGKSDGLAYFSILKIAYSMLK